MDLPSKSDSAEAAARRAQIVAAARALFEERGLSHTTVKDITEACGVTRDYEQARARIADGEFFEHEVAEYEAAHKILDAAK